MSTLTRMALLCLAALLIVSTVAAQEETVTIVDTTPPIESSIAENEEITDVPQQTETKSAAETTMLPAGPVLDIPAESLESKEDPDPESEESFTLPAGK
ncbi:uncharacterized protein LOC143783164 isoform X3 [Ranitomeya variabilis]|uniref:uncharacterized protein LOC143783164 isoform X3 n=1 Tax=Ranitomeya variabilis TaxID=490064 RepID=UPI004057C32B